MNCPHGMHTGDCHECASRVFNGLLDGFRLMGPTQVVDYAAEYFEDVARAMTQSGHAHGTHAKELAEFCRELRALCAKYKPSLGPKRRSKL